MADWKPKIATAILVNQAVIEADTEQVWPHHLPEVAATEYVLQKVESRIGHKIDPRYKAFLKHADGWRSFYQAADLFGTKQLLGAPPMGYAEEMLKAVEADVLRASGFERQELL